MIGQIEEIVNVNYADLDIQLQLQKDYIKIGMTG